MPTSYLPYAPNQDLLLPPSLSDWLPQGHLVHYISDTIDALDLRHPCQYAVVGSIQP